MFFYDYGVKLNKVSEYICTFQINNVSLQTTFCLFDMANFAFYKKIIK